MYHKIRKKLNFFPLFFQIIFWLSIAFFFVPSIFHIYPKVVLSGSMEPKISAGSLVYIDAGYPVEKIHQEDIIEYELLNGTKILHRVIDINPSEKYFITKGDANESNDLGKVYFSQYKGKFLLAIPYIGYGIKFFGNKYWIVGILFACIVFCGNSISLERYCK